MNIPADIALKLLETNFENVCAKLAAGGTLTVAEQKFLETAAAKSAKPTVSTAAPDAPPPADDPAPPPATDSIEGTSAFNPQPSAFSLSPSAPVPRKLTDYYKLPYKSYAPFYGLNEESGARTIKRWVKIGKNATPPDLPPLDEKEKMAAWWRRHMQQKPPESLLEIERVSPPREAAPSPHLPVNPQPLDPSSNSTPAAENRVTSIDPRAMDINQIDPLRDQLGLMMTYKKHLDDANIAGDSDEIRRWNPLYESALTSFVTLRRSEQAENKASGKSLNRDMVLTELHQLIETLRTMHSAMGAKILSELNRNATGRLRRVLKLLTPSLVSAIETIRTRELQIFFEVETLRAPGDVIKRIDSTPDLALTAA